MAVPGLQDSIAQSIAENPQWTGDVAPEPSAQGAPAAPPSPDTPAAPAEPAERFTDLDPAALPPDHQDAYKRMQADYTKKTQALAEERRRNEALAAQYQEYLEAQQAAPAAPAYGEYAPEQTGYDESPLAAELQQLKALVQQESQARRFQQVQSQMERLEQSLGRPLTQEEVQRTGPLVQRYPDLSVEDAYFLAHRKETEVRLRRQGAEETLKTLQQARGAPPPPSGLTAREAGPAALPNIKSAVAEALEQHGIR
jgi:hypothetical protein